MLTPIRRNALWLVAWGIVSSLGALWLARAELNQLRDAFETDARIAHRLLSQRVVQHDAVLAMLALLQPGSDPSQSLQRLPAVYPQILDVRRRERDAEWRERSLQEIEAASRQARRAMIADADLSAGRYTLLRAAEPASYAIRIDVREMVPWSEWPMAPEASPVRMMLEFGPQHFVLHPGRVGEGGWRFDFRKTLAADSQPFEVVAMRQVRWSELPWVLMSLWAVACGAALAAMRAVHRQRIERRRAEELLRLGHVARLNTLGELAAGMAHELNQPLTAVLASTQAARRLLQDDPPDFATARDAMAQAAEQARRASDVVGRMRRAVEKPDPKQRAEAVRLHDAVRNALYLLEPECQRRNVTPLVESSMPVAVQAEPVALEQIVHNLITNALQALEQVPAAERALTVGIAQAEGRGVLSVRDSGPGIPDEMLPRIFEPFVTSRSGGLGLGLSLSESLATGMGGTLAASNRAPRGAVFTLTLPLAARA